jgi:hypothetical protein
MTNRDMDVCNFCREESEYTLILYHKIGPKIYEPIPICPSCLYERGKYDSLRPESNIWTEEE